MFRFMKPKNYVSGERAKVQKELFSFNRVATHGFPHRPSALAWDPELSLLAIGTKTSVIRVYGAPGVEYCAQHESTVAVSQLFFIPGKGKIISICDDNSLHLWEIVDGEKENYLKEKKSCTIEGNLRRIYACSVSSCGGYLYVGTEGGNVYFLDIAEFKLTEMIIYQDVVVQNLEEEQKKNWGGVEAIIESPDDHEKLLIGYNRGLIVLWNCESKTAEKIFIANKDLHSLTYNRNGSKFISAHNDCSYFTWNADDNSKPLDTIEQCYGPYPCKAIDKIIWKTVKGKEQLLVFSGGMPRALYGDKYTVSVKKGEKNTVLDFTSKVVDFLVLDDSEEESENDHPHTLVVLLEEEVVIIDLESEDLLPFHLPYLSSLHSSVITCAQHYSNVPDDLWTQIEEAGKKQSLNKYTQRDWPITAGRSLIKEGGTHDLMITGHEDGSVKFWDASNLSLKLMYTLSTSSLFESEENLQNSTVEEEEWLHFSKAGVFDPYSDDPRLAIRKVALCLVTKTLVAAGTAGQILTFEISQENITKSLETLTVNFVGERDDFVWKGHEQLQAKPGELEYDAGFSPNVLIQLSPPATITALTLRSDWGLLAAGTAHGFGLFDYIQRKVVTSKCTLSYNDQSATGDTMSRKRTLKKSLRESFRRLRKGRSQRAKKEKSPAKGSEEQKEQTQKTPSKGTTEVSIDDRLAAGSSPSIEAKPVERQVEARASDDSLGSMVRFLCLTENFLVNNVHTTPTLWAGTNSGAIYVFAIILPSMEKRESDPVQCKLGKEIQLRHRAPVIAMYIIDPRGYPLSDPMEGKFPEIKGPHRVLICSEEQFKVFMLPSLKPYCKFKITANEGSRVRKVGLAAFQGRNDPNYREFCLTCLTNQGDLSLYSLPDLRRQLFHDCIKREDINGISSFIFTKNGEGFYLKSPCEFEHITLSTRRGHTPLCTLSKEEPGTLEVVVEELNESKTEDIKDEKNENKENENNKINEGNKAQKNSIEQDDRPKDLDITVDSIKDHLMSISSEKSSVIIEKSSKTETKTKMVTVKSSTVSSSTVISSDGTEEQVNKQVTVVNSSSTNEIEAH